MKILLVSSYLGRKEIPIYPLGLAMLATMLTEHDVKIYDPNVVEDPYGQLRMVLRRMQPDVVGLSLRNIDNQQRRNFFYFFKTVRPTVRIIREICPKALLVFGGPGFSMFARKIIELLPEVDIGVYLEGEEILPELLNNSHNPGNVKGVFYRKNGKVLFSGRRCLPDFAALPAPRKNLIDLKKYAFHQEGVGIQTKRGCSQSCCYCTYPFLNGNKIRFRKPEHVVDEIEDLVKRGVNGFMFADALFTLPLNHASEICHEIIRRKIKVTWSAWAEPQFITKGFLLLAKEAGCNFMTYSPDALSQTAIANIGKNSSKVDVMKVFKITKSMASIKSEFGFFVNPPGETLKGFLETLCFFFIGNLVLRLKKTGGVGLNWIRIEPDTKMFEIAVADGVITEETELLPEPEELRIDELFYSHPPMMKYDRFVYILMTLFEIVKDFLDLFKGEHRRYNEIPRRRPRRNYMKDLQQWYR